ncbi:histone-lysine N-methyltransferase SETMAR-like [Octopus sinensis]|uniref:Histone-lysine N-methyltransferase SETMAR-like n=1 Tax=Octopus sinensis TaxID=2607531 RepID=A0A6P7SJG0_9MOLL|nr:histone-lysine N-methyltransferase SETMAR-like [Octopus sinensis]
MVTQAKPIDGQNLSPGNFSQYYYTKLLPTALMTMLTTDQYRVIFLYEYKLGHSATKALRNIKRAFGNDSVDIRTVQRWFQRFRSGNESLKSESRGKPKSDIRHDELNALVKGNPRTTVRKIGSELQTSPATASRHLKKIRKVKTMDRFVPYQINEIQ